MPAVQQQSKKVGPWRTPFAELSHGFRAWRFCFRGRFPTWTRILNPFMDVFDAAQLREEDRRRLRVFTYAMSSIFSLYLILLDSRYEFHSCAPMNLWTGDTQQWICWNKYVLSLLTYPELRMIRVLFIVCHDLSVHPRLVHLVICFGKNASVLHTHCHRRKRRCWI